MRSHASVEHVDWGRLAARNVERLKQAMREEGFSAAVIGSMNNIHWLTGIPMTSDYPYFFSHNLCEHNIGALSNLCGSRNQSHLAEVVNSYDRSAPVRWIYSCTSTNTHNGRNTESSSCAFLTLLLGLPSGRLGHSPEALFHTA